MSNLLLLHIFSCWFLAGVIWIVQLLVYPFFQYVGENEFGNLHRFHVKRITWIVAPMMALELATAGVLFLKEPGAIFFWNFISVGSLWVLTALVNVPTHNNLRVSSEASKKNLVQRNWPRTFIWSVRALFLFFMAVDNYFYPTSNISAQLGQ